MARTMTRLLLAALCALAACNSTVTLVNLNGGGGAGNSGGAPAYYLMRHLNVPPGDPDPSLLPEGQQAAAMLAQLLAQNPPRAIFVSTFRRTQETAAPLAAQLGLTPTIYDPADMAGLVAQVRAAPGPVLIVGHSNTVPDIVEQLGGQRPGPIGEGDFGDLWIVGTDGSTQRARVAQ